MVGTPQTSGWNPHCAQLRPRAERDGDEAPLGALVEGAVVAEGRRAAAAALEGGPAAGRVLAARRPAEPRAEVDGEPGPKSNRQPDFDVSDATVSTRDLLLCFENSTIAIDSSKNQPNRFRIDRGREF